MVRQRPDSEEDRISRRNLLMATAGSAAFLAGCTGEDGSETPTSTPTAADDGDQGGADDDQDGSCQPGQVRPDADGSAHPLLCPPPEGEPIDDTLTGTGIGGPPANYLFNPWAVGQGETAWHLNRLIWEQFAWYDLAGDRFVNMLADEWEWDGQNLVLTLPDERTWSNGDDLVAEDVKMQFEFEKHLGPGGLGTTDIWNYTNNVVAVDDKTVRFELKQAYNQFTMQVVLLKRSTVTPGALYGEFYEGLQDATTESETESVVEDITNFTVGPASGGEQPVVTHSPWGFDRATEQRFVMALRDSGHELLDQYNFPYFEYVPMSQNAEMQAILSDDLDLIMRWSLGGPDYFSQLEDYQDVWHFQEGRGEGLLFNFGEDSPFRRGNRKVRQAIAHIIDPEPITENSGSYRIPITEYAGGFIPTSLSPTDFQKYVGDRAGDFIDYRAGNPHERATQLLNEAGFSKQDGTWVKPDGTPFQPVGISDAGHPDWVAVGQTIIRQLQEFGIQAEQTPLEGTQFSNRFDSGDWQMVFGSETQSGSRSPGPFFDYVQCWRNYACSPQGDCTATLYPSNDPVEVPPVGEPDAEPSLELVPNDLIDQMLAATTEEEVREPVLQAAWLQNYDLQMVDIMDASQHAIVTRDHWYWPPIEYMWGEQDQTGSFTGPSKRRAQNIIYHSIRGGEVQAQTQ